MHEDTTAPLKYLKSAEVSNSNENQQKHAAHYLGSFCSLQLSDPIALFHNLLVNGLGSLDGRCWSGLFFR